MKAELHFDLGLPAEKNEFRWATRGIKYLQALTEIESYFASKAKEETAFIGMRNKFYEILSEEGIISLYDEWENT